MVFVQGSLKLSTAINIQIVDLRCSVHAQLSGLTRTSVLSCEHLTNSVANHLSVQLLTTVGMHLIQINNKKLRSVYLYTVKTMALALVGKVKIIRILHLKTTNITVNTAKLVLRSLIGKKLINILLDVQQQITSHSKTRFWIQQRTINAILQITRSFVLFTLMLLTMFLVKMLINCM